MSIAKVNPAYTSKTCSRCGLRGNRRRHTFTCPHCGFSDHADLNAAKNIRDMRITSDATHHTVELILYLEGGDHAGETA